MYIRDSNTLVDGEVEQPITMKEKTRLATYQTFYSCKPPDEPLLMLLVSSNLSSIEPGACKLKGTPKSVKLAVNKSYTRAHF